MRGLRRYTSQLRKVRAPADVEREPATSAEGLQVSARRQGWYVDPRTDHEFVRDLYVDVLGRAPDASGAAWLADLLARGASRQAVTLELAHSEESLNRQWAARSSLQDLHELRPEAFARRTSVDGSDVEVLTVANAADLDWVERAILEHGYYEKPGIWSLAVDGDKRRMAEILAGLGAKRALELGCSSGAVLGCLDDLGVRAEGVEISRMAIQRADRAVRPRIHHGDVLELELEPGFDLVFGLDVFEHLNPNRFGPYLARVHDLLVDDGLVFVNSPAFGDDPVYGTLFPLVLPSWQGSAARGELFGELLVDEDGYPSHGHLVWAASAWWVAQFRAAGFDRDEDAERRVHERWDDELADTPARKAFFVFRKRAA